MVLLQIFSLYATAGFNPSAFLQKAINSDSCVMFGTSYGVHSILLKHRLIRAGGKCRAVDIDRIQQKKRAAIAMHLGEFHARIPSVFFNGHYYGGFDDLEGLFSHKALEARLWKEGATMLKCKPGLSLVPRKHERTFGAQQTKEYLYDTISKHKCLMFINSWCASNSMHHTRKGCNPASSWIENMLMATGAKCDILDLFKDNKNSGIIKIETPPNRGKMLNFWRARFGGPLPLASYLFVEVPEPADACSNLKGYYGRKVLLVRKSRNQNVCPFTQQLVMAQQAKAAGIIIQNDKDELFDLDGQHNPYLTIFAVSVSYSTGELIRKGIRDSMGFYSLYLEAGGHVEREVKNIAAKHHEHMPLLFLDGNNKGGEQRVAELLKTGELAKQLESAGAYEEEPTAPHCKSLQVNKLAAAEEKETSWFNWFGGRRLRSSP